MFALLFALLFAGILIGFLAGASLMAIRLEKLRALDPWHNPPTREAFSFKAQCMLHYHQHVLRSRPDSHVPALPIATASRDGDSALRLLARLSGVYVIQGGAMHFPGAFKIDLGKSARDIERALVDAYMALRSASVLLTDYVITYETPELAMRKPNVVLQHLANGWSPFPLADEIHALARLVDGVSAAENPAYPSCRYDDLSEQLNRWRERRIDGELTRVN